ncbi:MAG TPA: hypothetical protein VMH31_06370 [Methylomirabilota bacterium]|nr:hypothetical protein [Methylomirabilota bacterium]
MFRLGRLCLILMCLSAVLAMMPGPARGDEEEFDNSKYKLQLNGWVSAPAGYFNGANHDGYFDLQKDFGFGNYATFSGKFDWRFKRKHHLLFTATPVISSQTTTLTRTIEWQGQTYDVGARVNAEIRSLIFAPGYQWDFLRRKSGWLGLLVNCNLASTDAKLKVEGSVAGGGTGGSVTQQSRGSLFAPLPAIGPTFQWYPIPDNGRFYIDGSFTGMSFFGYGNFMSGNAILGFPIAHHWDARAGYLWGSRLKIDDSNSNISLRLVQKGPVFGVEYHWGTR